MKEHLTLISISKQKFIYLREFINDEGLAFSDTVMSEFKSVMNEVIYFKEDTSAEEIEDLGKRIKVLMNHLQANFDRHESHVPDRVLDKEALALEIQANRRKVNFDYIVQPIWVPLRRIGHWHHRKGRNVLDILKELRSRIGFFSLYKMGEQVEVNKIDNEYESQKIKGMQARMDHYERVLAKLVNSDSNNL